jgi:hypothetical protein
LLCIRSDNLSPWSPRSRSCFPQQASSGPAK